MAEEEECDGNSDQHEEQRFDDSMNVRRPVRQVLCKDCQMDFYVLNKKHKHKSTHLSINIWKCR